MMERGALDQERFEAIEAYVLGRMSDPDRERFESELARDASLRNELDLQREHILAVELGGMDRIITDLAGSAGEERIQDRPRSSSWLMYVKYAAMVSGLLLATWWLFVRPSENERIFAEYFVADPGLPLTMGSGGNHAFQDAMVAYELGDYSEARTKWSALLRSEPENDTLSYYIACASLGLGETDEAIPIFEKLYNNGSGAFRSSSGWYLFLALIRQGRLDDAMAVPLADDPTYGARVRSIHAQLRQ